MAVEQTLAARKWTSNELMAEWCNSSTRVFETLGEGAEPSLAARLIFEN